MTDEQLYFDDFRPGNRNPEMGSGHPGLIDLAGKPDPVMGRDVPVSGPAPGQKAPRNGQPAPQVPGDRIWAFDWSTDSNRGVIGADPRGYQHRATSLPQFIRDMPAGDVLVGESTFESYDLRRRREVIELAADRGVVLLTVPARGNTRRRERAGFGPKTKQSKQADFEDARAIQYAARNGAHLKVPACEVDPAWIARRDDAKARLRHLRRTGQKDSYARALLARLPPCNLQPTVRRVALGPVDGVYLAYNPVIIAAVGVASEYMQSRDEFERLTGLYAHGYPSLFRSDLMHWGWNRYPIKQERISISDYRRELRWLFHQLNTPSTGLG